MIGKTDKFLNKLAEFIIWGTIYAAFIVTALLLFYGLFIKPLLILSVILPVAIFWWACDRSSRSNKIR